MIEYPSYVKTAITLLEQAGHSAYVVGGALRDALLGAAPEDWDITTSATPDEMQKLFCEFGTVDSGLKHGTLSVIIEHRPVEITTFRIDGGYADSRHPTSVTFTRSLEEDLARRDFTVNALAYSEKSGLVDLFDGQKDLKNKIIRAVGDPARRFGEDALRILRAFRFAAKLGFRIEENTLRGITECRTGLRNISAERIAHELVGILEGKWAYESLCEMERSGVLALVAPPMAMGLEDATDLASLPAEFPVRAALLLRNSTEDEVASLLGTLRLSNQTVAHVKRLLALLPLVKKTENAYGVRLLLSRAGEQFEELLLLATATGVSVAPLSVLAREINLRGDCTSLSALAVDGKELCALGFRGKEVGDCLAELFDLVLHDPSKNKRDTLLALAAKKKTLDK